MILCFSRSSFVPFIAYLNFLIGGTAGCVVASRLSEDSDISVLLLERGPVEDTWMSRIPIVSSNILKVDGVAKSWNCEPMKHCDNRQSLFFRGEVMGGGSRINAMVYTRGTKAGYDVWAALGHPDWSFEKVLPFFVMSEKTLNQPKSSYRGDSGKCWKVEEPPPLPSPGNTATADYSICRWLNRNFPYATWRFKVYQM